MTKKNNNLKITMTIIITAVVTFSVTTIWLYGKINKNSDGETVIGSALEDDGMSAKLKIIKDKIEKSFMGEIDEKQLKEYAIKGYIAGLDDEYSQYFTQEEMKKYTENTLGNYVGIGVYMTKNTEKNGVEVYSVIPDSPAEEVGMQKGDLIIKVEDKEVTSDDFENVSSWIEGKIDTKVNVTVLRDEQKITFEITRKKVTIINVKSEMLDNKIGYIYISSFDGDVSEQFKKEYDKLVAQGMNSLIIDLRNNGGGIATEAVEIGDYFTQKGEKLLIEEDKNGKENITKAKEDKTIFMKTAVLINEYSASASEILAGILKDLVEEATLIGNTSYGKGVIQSLYTLSDGSGLKITTNQYFTPNHSSINKKGITPDIETEEYKFTGELDKENDIQLQKAIEICKNS